MLTFFVSGHSFAAEDAIEKIAIDAADVNVDAPVEDATITQRWKDKAQEVLLNALSLTGIEYKYGGNGPDTGFDCSGFVRFVFQQAVNISLPRTARSMSQVGRSVTKDHLQPGDLVFFKTIKSAISHVGIYIGDNRFIHSPHTGATVRVDSLDSSYWSSRFGGAKRLDEADKAENP